MSLPPSFIFNQIDTKVLFEGTLMLAQSYGNSLYLYNFYCKFKAKMSFFCCKRSLKVGEIDLFKIMYIQEFCPGLLVLPHCQISDSCSICLVVLLISVSIFVFNHLLNHLLLLYYIYLSIKLINTYQGDLPGYLVGLI